MSRSNIYIILILGYILYACNREEATMLSGDITGYIQVYDENWYSLSDKSGVTVILIDNSTTLQTTSDEQGRFIFENILYGNYIIDLRKEDYVKEYSDYRIHHLGGYSPTILNFNIFEVPEFELMIDSVIYDPENWRFSVYGKISGNEGKSRYLFYYLRCFFNDSPSVSKDHFKSVYIGVIEVSDEENSLVSGYVHYYSEQHDSVYMCAYPQAYGQWDGNFYYEESLGKPSNVIGFLFEP